jgi:hypothetical protein
MTMARVILGEAFLAVLVFAVVYAAVAPTLQPITLPQIQMPGFGGGGNMVIERYSLIEGSNVSESVTSVDLNVSMKFGGIRMIFSERDDLAFEAVFQRSQNATQLEADYTQNATQLHVDTYAETGTLNLTLGRNYQYSGNMNISVGGLVTKLGQNTNMETFAVNIKYAGGVFVTISDGASFQRLDLNIDVGGVQLSVDAKNLTRNGLVTTGITVGGLSMGVNVDPGKVGVSLAATVDIGGININNPSFTGQVSSTHATVQTQGYNTATNKLDVQADIGLGGVTLTQTTPTIPGLNA